MIIIKQSVAIEMLKSFHKFSNENKCTFKIPTHCEDCVFHIEGVKICNIISVINLLQAKLGWDISSDVQKIVYGGTFKNEKPKNNIEYLEKDIEFTYVENKILQTGLICIDGWKNGG